MAERGIFTERLILKPEILRITGLSFPTIWAMMRRGEFPRSLIVSGRTAWYSSEIEAWMRSLKRRRLKGDPDA